ncbi:hypothetical protein HDU67_009321 [Dinochytrium kinnereticum]|nr:hypothetical protein HDU67_009321 [Dinochytrium kinnereticum]
MVIVPKFVWTSTLLCLVLVIPQAIHVLLSRRFQPQVIAILNCSGRIQDDAHSVLSVLNQKYHALAQVIVASTREDLRRALSGSKAARDFRSTRSLTLAHISPNTSDVIAIRNILLEKVTGLIDVNKSFLLFLDHCERLNSPEAVGEIVEAWELSSQRGLSVDFVSWEYKLEFTNRTFQFMHGARLYNPYDWLVKEDTSKLSVNTSLTSTSSVNGVSAYTSMFLPYRTWQKHFHIDENLDTALRSMFMSTGLAYASSKFQYGQDTFWQRFSLNGLKQLHIQLPLVTSGPLPTIKGPYLIGIRSAANVSRDILQRIAILKRLWRPSISVIVPFYNIPSAEWFYQTMQSLKRQSIIDFEVIIVDDGSSSFTALSALMALSTCLERNNGLWYGICSRTGEDRTALAIPIPVRIIRHRENLGLSEARNTGVINAKAPFVLFLDPDDILAPTALEKLILAAMWSFGPQKRYPSRKISFAYPGVVHFRDEENITMEEANSRAVYAEYSSKRLRKENFLTSTALISKDAYLKVGGMCPRSTLRSFEDYDFWLRMDAFEHHGLLVREPLFWYRRHGHGNSQKILTSANTRKENWMDELITLNPISFGRISLEKAKTMLRTRLSNPRSSKAFMPCYRKVSTEASAPRFLSGMLSRLKIKYYGMSHPQDTGFTDEMDKVRQYLFPYSMSFFEREQDHHWVLYSIPWMVMGGADLYDVNVLSSLQTGNEDGYRAKSKVYKSLLVVARFIPNHEWHHKFAPLVSDIFYLQQMTNDSRIANWIMDYLSESRGISIFINSRTVPGYEAIERWGRNSLLDPANRSTFFPRSMVDILHLHHPPHDHSNWEHRSARCSKYLTRRIVVSENLRNHLINTLGYGDLELGAFSKEQRGTLSEKHAARVKVIPPPLDLSLWMKRYPQDWEWFADNNIWPSNEVNNRPTLFFIGRFDHQKDPLLWLDVATKAFTMMKKAGVFLNLVMIGGGPLQSQIRSVVKKSSTLSNAISFVDVAMTEHCFVLREIAKPLNAVTLLSSNLEGVPIVALESAGLGIPVVTTDCGGITEIFANGHIDSPDSTKEGRSERSLSTIPVARTLLSAVIGVRCQEIGTSLDKSRDVVATAMANEVVRFLMLGRATRESAILRRRQRWRQAKTIRDFYNSTMFRIRWREELDSIVNSLQ